MTPESINGPFEWFYNRGADLDCARETFPQYNKPWVFPVYIVCDESTIINDQAVGLINGEIAKFLDDVRNLIWPTEVLRISLIASDRDARTLVTLAALDELTEVPKFSISHISNYLELFELLRIQLEQDVMHFHNKGFMMTRPVVFFITKGQPQDNSWEKSFNELVNENFRFRPNLVLYGVPNFDASILANLVVPILSVGASRLKGLSFDGRFCSVSDALVETVKYMSG